MTVLVLFETVGKRRRLKNERSTFHPRYYLRVHRTYSCSLRSVWSFGSFGKHVLSLLHDYKSRVIKLVWSEGHKDKATSF